MLTVKLGRLDEKLPGRSVFLHFQQLIHHKSESDFFFKRDAHLESMIVILKSGYLSRISSFARFAAWNVPAIPVEKQMYSTSSPRFANGSKMLFKHILADMIGLYLRFILLTESGKTPPEKSYLRQNSPFHQS